MHRSFSYTLLITWILFFFACRTSIVTTSVTSQNIRVTEDINPVDSQLIRIYIPFKNMLEKDMSRVISYSETALDKGKPESKLTNFLADLLIEEGRNEAEKLDVKFKPQISYFNYGGIRAPISKGNITVGNIFELMPFENEMVFVRLSGAQLQEFLNNIATKGGDSVGGVRFEISDQKAKNIMVGGKKLNPENDYWVVTNDYIANGGDGMNIFLEKKEIINTGEKIRDVIISNLEKKQSEGEKLDVDLDGRITNE